MKIAIRQLHNPSTVGYIRFHNLHTPSVDYSSVRIITGYLKSPGNYRIFPTVPHMTPKFTLQNTVGRICAGETFRIDC